MILTSLELIKIGLPINSLLIISSGSSGFQPAGKSIIPHVHNLVMRHVDFTQEVLFLRKGRLRVDFFDDSRVYLESYVLGAGDVILLVSGGHGFEVLEDVEMFEVKQGPYVGEEDKTRFDPGAFAVNYKRQSNGEG